MWVVGIGSSAGGLEALQSFVANVPPNLPAAIIIAQHLAPHAKSMMVELLSRHSKMPVNMAVHGEKLRKGRIYMVPPNHDIDLNDGKLFLPRAGVETRPKPSVDTFFDSLARNWGEYSVGIILSGTGSDGAEGIQAIRSAGGLTIAQDDHSARYDGMPKSAVESGGVSAIMAPDAMARELPKLLNEHAQRREISGPRESEFLQSVLDLLQQQTGMNFKQYKTPTMRRRIEKHMRAKGLEDNKAYLEDLRKHPEGLSELSQELLISVTSFFRDRDAFDALENHLDEIVKKHHDNEEIRAWVAGCATGEEAYSVAILMAEAIRKSGRNLKMKVFATDLDQEALVEARTGIYGENDVRAVPAHLVSGYFHRRGNDFEVDKVLRDCVVFARQDLGQSAPFVKMDIVTCRNVLIYFGPALQKKIFELFHYALNPGGILLLGKSESVGEVSTLFEFVDRKVKLFRKLNVVSKVVPSTNYMAFQSTAQSRRSQLPSLGDVVQKEVFAQFQVAGVVVDEAYNMVNVIGDIAPFVRIPEGQTSLNLIQGVPRSAAAEIPVLIKKALKTGEPQRSRAYPMRGSKKTFELSVRPLPREQLNSNLFLLLFESRKAQKSSMPLSPSSLDGDISTRAMELEKELSETREHLQSVVEELGVSNEELQSLNEELNSTNEELQSTNEEMETTNEELQSANEELTTVNEELANKTTELKHSNVNLENVQNSIGSPMVVIDNEMRVIRFNTNAHRIFEINASDVGRNITRVSCQGEIPKFYELIAGTLDTGKPQEAIIDLHDTIYQMRVMPSMDENQRIVGAILVFFNNTELIRAEENLRTSERRIRAIINCSPSLITLKDTLGRYLTVNTAFADYFGVGAEEIIGKTDREVFDSKIATQLRDGDLEVFYKRASIRREEPLGTDRTFLVVRFPLFHDHGQQPYAVGMVAIDVTERVNIQKQLIESEGRYRGIVEDQAVLVCRFDPSMHITFANMTLATYFGGSMEHYVGEEFLKLIAEDDRAHVRDEINRISVQVPVVYVEHRVGKLGKVGRWVRWTVKGVFQNNELTGYQAVGFDITENRIEADRLQARELIMSHIFGHTTDYLTVYKVMPGPEFLVEAFNPSAEQMMGFSFGHFLGRNLRSLLPKEKYDKFVEKFRQCVATREPQTINEEVVTPAGTKYLSTKIIPVISANGKVERLASMARDISDIKKIEEELRAERDRAEMASKSKSDFLATMSHELRTPLNVVLGMSQLLQDSELADDQHKLVSSIQRSGTVLLGLIEDILDLSKIEEGRLRLDSFAFDLHDLVAEIADSYEPIAEKKNLTFKYNINADTPRVVAGDPGRVRQIIVNLISNAIKFTDEGGVTLKVKSTLAGGNRVTLHFDVSDTGIGIKEDQHARLFQKFSQAESGSKRRYAGTGLGLAICRRLVGMMQGKIGFESRYGHGSTFWFEIVLPLVDKDLRRPGHPDEKNLPQSEDIAALKILAVDDNFDSQVFIQLLLKSMGHKVKTASSGKEAIGQLQSETFDLVLMDVQMPELDGFETTEKIRQLGNGTSKIPVIAMTANAMAEDAKKCLDAGMDDYISKPVHKDALKAILAKWSQDEGITKRPN